MLISALAARNERPFLAVAALSGMAVAAVIAFCGAARAQEPSGSALASAKELIELKGATHMFDPVVPGVIETAKNTFLQTNPGLSKDLNEVATKLRSELAGKRAEIANEIARIYAQQFTEKELKDAVTFYKTPLGKKLIDVEPRVLDQGMTAAQSWADRFSEEVVRKFRAEMKRKGHDI